MHDEQEQPLGAQGSGESLRFEPRRGLGNAAAAPQDAPHPPETGFVAQAVTVTVTVVMTLAVVLIVTVVVALSAVLIVTVVVILTLGVTASMGMPPSLPHFPVLHSRVVHHGSISFRHAGAPIAVPGTSICQPGTPVSQPGPCLCQPGAI